MTAGMWGHFNRQQDSIIFGSTSLKIKVELQVGGVAQECAVCNNTHEAKTWVTRKVKEYAIHSPMQVHAMQFVVR